MNTAEGYTEEDRKFRGLHGETPNDWVVNLHEAGEVLRYHTDPLPVKQNNAEHSWGVAMLIHFLHMEPSARLLSAALIHDLHEKVAGDAPGITKFLDPDYIRAYQKLEETSQAKMGIMPISLTDAEAVWLKFADGLEAGLWGAYLYRRFGYPRGRQIAERSAWMIFQKETFPPPEEARIDLREFVDTHLLFTKEL